MIKDLILCDFVFGEDFPISISNPHTLCCAPGIQVCLKIHLDPDPDPGSKKINKKMFQNIPVKLSKCNGKSILSNPLTTINYFSFFSFWILKFSHGCGSVRIRIQYWCTLAPMKCVPYFQVSTVFSRQQFVQ